MRKVLLTLALASTLTAQQRQATPARPAAPPSVRLYILDCGTIGSMNPESYDLRAHEIKGSLDFITPCYLVVHPRGTLMWDVGQIADANMPASGPGVQGPFRTPQKLLPQLQRLGYAPADITYMAMSHYHGDHAANANEFAASTWIVQEPERAAMFTEPPPRMAPAAQYSKLKDAKTILVKSADHDVFGDGAVVLKFAPGHTPGHQMLFLRFAKTGPVLLAGDLYHYPEERTLDRIPTFDTDRNQTRETRKKTEEFLKASGAALWIQHDMALHEKLRKAPDYID
jgi:glyoxylase-like metal-dependent hydrolase (beta-lactamase superfamily II)